MRNAFSSAFKYLLLCALLAGWTAPARSQEFPNRPVRVVVPYGAGAATDIVARIIGGGFTKTLGQPVVIENRPGASGMVAYEYVARQVPADGYTLVVGEPGLTSLQVFVKDLRVDLLRELPPIAIFTELLQFLATPAGTGWKTFDEMIAFARANPGKVNWGTPGLQSPQALFAEVIKLKRGIDMAIIPYKGGGGEVIGAMNAGQIQLAIYVESMARAQAEKVRILAVSGEKRVPLFPDVPTFNELGLPEIMNVYLSLNAPAATPKPIVNRIHTALQAALKMPEVRDGLVKIGLPPVIGSTPEQANRILSEALRVNTEIGKKAGIKPE